MSFLFDEKDIPCQFHALTLCVIAPDLVSTSVDPQPTGRDTQQGICHFRHAHSFIHRHSMADSVST